jgi:nitrous oxide reductase accessory protein NosL
MFPTGPILSCLLLAGGLSGRGAGRGSIAVEAPQACGQCGMDRHRFARSRMLLEREDGSSTGVCSLHCALEALEDSQGSPVRALRVADRAHPQTLVEARTCTWVIGGDLPGVMARTGTWAFGEVGEARAFARRHGGRIAGYEAARKALRQEGAE